MRLSGEATRGAMFLSLALVTIGGAQARPENDRPLVISSQGSFYVGGELKALVTPAEAPPADAGDITVNQMYVQYQIPLHGDRHTPVVMVHGCCLSSKTWETTPDGRMGWAEYFVRKERGVYLADQVSRARSGFDPTILLAVRAGSMPPSALPSFISASHQLAWTVFRFGRSYQNAFADSQFPIESVDELYKQMIPDLNAFLPTPNPTWTNMAALAKQLGGAVLMGHSESGFFPEQAALIDSAGIKSMISIEPGECPADLTTEQVAKLATIPTLIMFGDHLDVMTDGDVFWQKAFDSCEALVEKLKAMGGDAEMLYLPSIGIHGNSHMLMQDKNNAQLAELILKWIDRPRASGHK